MNVRTTLSSVFACTALFVVGWQFGAAGVTTVTAMVQPEASTGSSPVGTGTPPGATEQPASGSGTPGGTTDGTYTGASVRTRFGDVQVQVTVSGGTLTDVTALQLTDADRTSVQISNRAAPILRTEVLASQSAAVQTVSGATYTSQGYLGSVQSALDAAGF